MGDLISVYIAHAGPEEDVTVLTSSRDGIQKQEDHFGRLQQHDTSDWNLIPYGYCTYRNRSDDGLFTFNVNKVADRGIVSKFYPVFETSECDADFLVAYLNSSQEIRKKLFVLAVGTSQVVLSYGALKELSLLLPQNREQSAIANVLNHIDNLITLHQRKCQYRGLYGCLSWEQRKLGEFSKKKTTKNADGALSETFTNSAEQGVISQLDYFDHDITNDANISGYYVVQPDDFVYNPRISATAPCGPINRNRLNRAGVMSPLYTVFSADSSVDKTYLEHYFKTSRWHAFMFLEGNSGARSDRFSISDATFFEMPIWCPEISEQMAIAKQLETADSLITLHQ